MRYAIRFMLWAFVCVCAQLHAATTTIQVNPDHEDGLYDAGQTVTWSVLIENDKKPATGKFTYIVKLGGLEKLSEGEVELTNEGKATVTGTRPDPGALLLEVTFKVADDPKPLIGRGGAAFSYEKIKPSMPPPADFDKFWADKVAALNAIPMNAVLTKVDSGDPKVEYFKITMDNINGTKIQGQFAKPAGDVKDLPAMLQVQYAGVYKLIPNAVIDQAKRGWLSINIEAHDIAIDEKPEYYKNLQETTLKDYAHIGNDDCEKSYFLRMLLSAYRAADYVIQRPEWNKKTFLVQGGSQGGYQTLVMAGLHPAVTAYTANVPAGCDHTGKAAKRAPGWPNWANGTGADYDKKFETGRYFDCMNFAPRIKAPGMIALGLTDTTCPPEGVLATCNAITAEKKLIIMPKSDHKGPHDAYYKEFGPFLEVYRKK